VNINEFNIILGIVASLCTIGVAVAVTIRWIQDPTSFGPEMTRQRLIALTLAVMTGIVVIAVVISNVASAAIAGTASTSTPGNGLAAPTAPTAPTATTDTSIIVATDPTATNISGVVPTETPVDVPTISGNASYGTQTITPNWQLDCSGCNQPVLVTVSKIAVDAGNQNMVWTFTLKNHTADNVSKVYFSTLYLVDQADPNNNRLLSTGAARSANPGASMTVGNSTQVQATFSFLPKHQGSYTLTAYLESYIIGPDYYTGSSYQQTITFP
jgi:hypothetical protein